MYEDERVEKLEVGKSYKKEILKDFVIRNNYQLCTPYGANCSAFYADNLEYLITEIKEGGFNIGIKNRDKVLESYYEGIVFAERKMQ